jgi:predicted nuclease of restriction endonuclease-like (RecB) superfamily
MSKRPQKPVKAAAVVPTGYGPLLAELKSRVRAAQVRAALSVNAHLVWLYWQIGHRIAQQQAKEGWGAGVIPRLAADLHAEFPELKGFSERNIGRMIRFSGEYPDLFAILPPAVAKLSGTEFVQQPAGLCPEGSAAPIVPQAAAQLSPDDPISILPQLAAKLPWAHHVILMEKVKDRSTRLWYMQHAIEHGWSRAVLTLQIETQAHRRMGKALTNFAQTLLPPQSDLAQQVLKDPYTLDFLTLSAAARERELEQGLTEHIQKFLLELGVGFAFVGRQVHLEVGGEDYYLDLLFYHLKLRCFVVLDLKVESLPKQLRGALPSVEDLEKGLADDKP